MKATFFRLGLALACISLLATIPYRAAASVTDEYHLLRMIPASVLDTLTNNAEPDSAGAMQLNRGQWTDVVYQRVAIPLIYVGAVENDASKVDDGWKAIDLANQHIDADGGFATSPGRTMSESEMVFWIEAVTHAFAVLNESPLRERYESREQSALSYIRKNVDWLLSDDRLAALQRFDEPATNRLFLDASGFEYAALLLDDPSLKSHASYFLDLALAHQRSDGVFLEEHGFDSSYQAVSLLHATHYALLNDPDGLRAALLTGTNREVEAVTDTGGVDTSENTRTGGTHMVNGHSYAVDYRSVVLGLYYAGLFLDQQSAISAAQHVYVHVFHKSPQ